MTTGWDHPTFPVMAPRLPLEELPMPVLLPEGDFDVVVEETDQVPSMTVTPECIVESSVPVQTIRAPLLVSIDVGTEKENRSPK